MTPVYEFENTTASISREYNPLQWVYKLEPVAALVIAVAVSPVVVIIGIMISLLSRQSPLIRHTRVGWHGDTLPMLKFRTMWGNALTRTDFRFIEDVSDVVPVRKNGADPRVSSRFAALCRRYSLDELPQIYHVLRGQMSFVGPRPLTQVELDAHYGPRAMEVLQLKPGLTGLWQVMGRNRLTYSRRLKLDVLLVRRASIALYFRILVLTIPKVVRGNDAC